MTPTNYTLNSTIGKSCEDSAYCIINSYCSIAVGASVGVCTCGTTYYLDTATQMCLPRNTYSVACSYDYNCMSHKRLICTSGACSCSSTMFWNTTALECQFLKVPYTFCTSVTEGVSNTQCNTPSNLPNSVIRCSSSYWYNPNTGQCELMAYVAASCNYDRQCTDNSYCQFPSTSSSQKVCICDSGFYTSTSQTCSMKTFYQQGCSTTINNFCNLNQMNLRCFSGTCNCDTNTEYWDAYYLKCLPLRTYGQTCGVGSLSSYTCQSIFTCTYPSGGTTNRKACLCSSGNYFDPSTGTCQATVSYNSICYNRYMCSNQITMACITQNGGTTKRCLCAPNYAYYDPSVNTCTLMKRNGVGCNTNTAAYGSQCQTYYGMFCTPWGSCQCYVGRYLDSTTGRCIPTKRKYSGCTSNYQCPQLAYFGAFNSVGHAGWGPPSYGYCNSNYYQ